MLSGLHIQYYIVCKRKLWLYAKNINLAPDYDKVIEGAVLHERADRRIRQRDLKIDDQLQIDAMDRQYVREVKNSSKMHEADRWQLLFYLYELKKRGVEKKGLLQYTKERKTEEIELTSDKIAKIDKMIPEIEQIIGHPKPPKFIKKRYCRSCAYHDFCFAGEESD